MPIYDYVCTECGNEFELLVFSREKPLCPKCNSAKLEKKMSTFAFKSGAGSDSTSGSTSSKCSGCAGGSCSSCH